MATAPSILKNKKVLLLITIVFVVGVLVWFVVSRNEQKKATPKSLSKQDVAALNMALQKGDYTTAQRLLNESSSSKKQLAVLVGTAQAKGDYKAVLGFYKEYEQKYRLNYDLAESIAAAYQKLNDKTNAQTYYQKAIDLRNKSKDPAVKAEVARLEKILEDLKK